MSVILKDISDCIWCEKKIKRGQKVYKLINGKFNYHLSKLITSLLYKNNVYCNGVKKYLLSFLHNENDNKYTQIYCLKCGTFDLRCNSFGRMIRKPIMFYQEEYLNGSGFVGCDSYDRSYDRGVFIDRDNNKNINLKNFIVRDDFVEFEEYIDSDESEFEEYIDSDESESEEYILSESDKYDSESELDIY